MKLQRTPPTRSRLTNTSATSPHTHDSLGEKRKGGSWKLSSQLHYSFIQKSKPAIQKIKAFPQQTMKISPLFAVTTFFTLAITKSFGAETTGNLRGGPPGVPTSAAGDGAAAGTMETERGRANGGGGGDIGQEGQGLERERGLRRGNFGYCNWGWDGTGASSTCSGGGQGGTWCNVDKYNCETGCGGRWCFVSRCDLPQFKHICGK